MLDFASFLEAASQAISREPMIARPASSSFAIRRAVSLIILGLCMLGLGCREHQTICAAESRTPDGRWLASASTVQHSGPGNAGLYTSVYLKRTNDSSPGEEVLGFSHDPTSQSSTIELTMTWITPSHLEVDYNGHASVYFQVVKYAGIDISVRDLSRLPTNDLH